VAEEATARRRRSWIVAAAVLGLLGLAAAALLLRSGAGDPPPPALADATPYDGRSPREPSARATRVVVALARPSLGAAGIADPGAQRAYVRSLEAESGALRSALGTRGIRLSDVVTFARTFNGFAATVRTRDLADLPSLGVRAQPVRRFYPASSEPARVAGLRPPGAAAPLGGASVAVLDAGVDASHPLLAGRLDPGYDAVDRDDDPAPAGDPRGGRRETSGTALAGILVAAGERVVPIRVAGLQPAIRGPGTEDVALTDQLLAGLERAVDPDGDGATDDRVPVALVGVNSPYAGFAASPEARAVQGATDLGTLVVAPAGGEGVAAGPDGTVGSPAAAPEALAVGALAAPEAVARVDLEVGEADARGTALLAGAPPPRGLRTAVAEGARGRLAVVRAGDAPVAQAAAAAAAGARAVLLAEPRRRRPLPAIPAGRIAVPVLGVTGAAAANVLEQAAGAAVTVGAVRAGRPPAATLASADAVEADVEAETGGGGGLSPFSSRGPAAWGGVKPTLAAPGAALTALPGGGGAVVGGSAVAAARTAIAAAQLARARPSAPPRELSAALGAAAAPDPGLPARGAGAGALRPPPPAVAPVTARTTPQRRADPCPGAAACVRVTLANPGAAPADLALSLLPDPGTRAALARARVTIPPGGRREAEIEVAGAGAGGLAAGRLVARTQGGATVLVHPFALAVAPPVPPPLGRLELQRDGGRVTGVRFPLGAFARGDPLGGGTRVALTERLALTLTSTDGDRVVRRLTPPGGARELLPAEYAYTLPAGTLRALGGGRLAFRAVARSPRGGEPAEARSEPFAP